MPQVAVDPAHHFLHGEGRRAQTAGIPGKGQYARADLRKNGLPLRLERVGWAYTGRPAARDCTGGSGEVMMNSMMFQFAMT